MARAANLNKGQASRSAQALVDRGLVEKTVSASDGRGVVLAPTADGLTQYRRIVDLIARRNDEIFGCLTADEQQQFGDMLDLARAANLNKGQASRSAQALVDRGLVEKTVSAS
ncbi:hypothetical protein CTI14_54975, partial [Methylobacterium radiotolerans]